MKKTLFEQLDLYNKMNNYPFHMPGHKRRLAPEGLEHVYGMDITEIDGFDNLHHAEGILKEAQDLAAEVFGSAKTHILVGGSTAGILSAIAAVCPDGSKIMVARNCHKSVYHAIEMHHLIPAYIYPPVNEVFGIQEGISVKQIEDLWITHPDCKAIVITSPTYDGVVSDVAAIADFAHSKGIPLIVDEAHGAHFHFSDYFPKSAVECGADLVIQSTHKTLPTMTQTAVIHVNGDLVDRVRVGRMLSMYQTSSPSYILMGSVDACMHLLKDEGVALFASYTKALEALRRSIKKLKYIRMPEIGDLNASGTFDYDRSKLVLSVRGTDLTGPMLHEKLLHTYGIQMEMVSADYVLAMTSVGDSNDGYERLIKALTEIDSEMAKIDVKSEKKKAFTSDEKEMEIAIKWSETALKWPETVARYSIYDASWMVKETTLLKEAAGRVSGGYIYLYPPGIPLVTPGEVITDEVIGKVDYWIRLGMEVTGVSRADDTYQNDTYNIEVLAEK